MLPVYRPHLRFGEGRPGPPGSACVKLWPIAWTVGRGGLSGFGNLEGSHAPKPKALDQAQRALCPAKVEDGARRPRPGAGPVGAVSCGGGGRGSEAACGLQPSPRHRERCTYVLLYPGWSRSWQMAAVIRTRMSICENFSWVGEGWGWSMATRAGRSPRSARPLGGKEGAEGRSPAGAPPPPAGAPADPPGARRARSCCTSSV